MEVIYERLRFLDVKKNADKSMTKRKGRGTRLESILATFAAAANGGKQRYRNMRQCFLKGLLI